MMNLLVKFTIFYLFNHITYCYDQKENEVLKSLKNNKPEVIDNIIFCEACKYYTRLALKFLKGKKSENDIFSIVNEDLCKPEHINIPMRG